MTGSPDRSPGERPPSARLERAPGERYAPRATEQAATPRRQRVIATLGALLIAVLGGLALAGLQIVDFGVGLVVIGAVIGWAEALSLRYWAATGALALRPDRRALVAAVFAAAGVILAYVVIWVVERSLIDPLAYAFDRFGPLPALILASAVLVAAARAR